MCLACSNVHVPSPNWYALGAVQLAMAETLIHVLPLLHLPSPKLLHEVSSLYNCCHQCIIYNLTFAGRAACLCIFIRVKNWRD